MLERPLTTRFSRSCDVQNDFYSTLNEVTIACTCTGKDIIAIRSPVGSID